MKNCLLVFDKFKDSLSAKKIGESLIKGLKLKNNFNYLNKPLSDGGEGFLNLFLNNSNLKIKNLKITGSLGKKINCDFIFSKEFSIIEMSLVCGLEQIKNLNERNPERTTTRGIGEIIEYCYKNGCKNILLG
jgi:glycerate 2-kinase